MASRHSSHVHRALVAECQVPYINHQEPDDIRRRAFQSLLKRFRVHGVSADLAEEDR